MKATVANGRMPPATSRNMARLAFPTKSQTRFGTAKAQITPGMKAKNRSGDPLGM